MRRWFTRGALILAGVVAAGLGSGGPVKAQVPELSEWQFVLHRLEKIKRAGCFTREQEDYLNNLLDTLSRYKKLSFTGPGLFEGTPAYNRLSSRDKHKADLIARGLTDIAFLPFCGPRINFAIQGNAGEARLPEFRAPLQLEYGGMVVVPSYGSIERHDTSAGIDVKGSIRLPGWETGWGNGLPRRSGGGYYIHSLYGAGFYYIPGVQRLDFGYRHQDTSGNTSVGSLSTGGKNLNVISSAGPDGKLHGGVTVNDFGIGFANVTDLQSSYNLSQDIGYLGVTFKLLKIGQTGTEITPRMKMIVGHQRESTVYSGKSAAGTLDFQYLNEMKMTSLGAGVGVHVKQPIDLRALPMCRLSFYVDGEMDVTNDDASLDSTFNLGGLLNTTEMGSASSTKVHLGGMVDGGVEIDTGKAKINVGASVQWQQQPVATYSQSAPVGIDWEQSEVYRGMIGLTVPFK